MATEKKARMRAGPRKDGTTQRKKTPALRQEVFSNLVAEEALIGAALINWSYVAPHAARVTDDLFTDPSLLTMWKAIAANPTAGLAAIPPKLAARSTLIIEHYNGEEPGAIIRILIEARDSRTLETAAEQLLHPRTGETAATTWARVKSNVDKITTPPATETTTRWTPEALAAADFPTPDWLIPNLLPTGITLLAGRPKTGKSWLALLWASRIKGGTVYAAYEDNARRLKDRTETLEIKNDNLILIPSPPWRMPEALDALTGDVHDYKPSTIIIDPWAYFAPTHQNNSRIYEVDYSAIAQLRRWAEDAGVSVVIIHHSRKPTPGQRGDFLDEPLGSTALTGAVDTVAVLKRKNDREATLHIRGRDVETKELALTFDAGLWEILGDARGAAITGARAEALDVLKEATGPLKAADVAHILNQNPDSVRVVLNRMYADGQVTKDEQSRYGVIPVTAVTVADF